MYFKHNPISQADGTRGEVRDEPMLNKNVVHVTVFNPTAVLQLD